MAKRLTSKSWIKRYNSLRMEPYIGYYDPNFQLCLSKRRFNI